MMKEIKMTQCLEVVEFDKWEEFRKFIEKNFFHKRSFIFRGQRDSEWKLETTLDRLIKQLPEKLQTEKIVDGHLDRFKKCIRGKRGPNPTNLENSSDIWALGQHYGLATPLLDWSHSPYIATFFAFSSNTKPSTEKRSIYAIEINWLKKKEEEIETKFKENNKEGLDHFFEKKRLPIISLVDPFLEDNPRIINQAGIFTRAPILMPIDDWVEKFCINEHTIHLYKINIANSERDSVLANLEYMNIHSASLFPDLSGASMYCNEYLTLRGKIFETMKQK